MVDAFATCSVAAIARSDMSSLGGIRRGLGSGAGLLPIPPTPLDLGRELSRGDRRGQRTGANGPLGSVTGTVYAAQDRALFTDKVSGTSKLAIMTGCIYVDGSTSTFNFDRTGLYGNGLTFLSQSG